MNTQFDLLQYILCRRPQAPDEATTPRPTDQPPVVTPEGRQLLKLYICIIGEFFPNEYSKLRLIILRSLKLIHDIS